MPGTGLKRLGLVIRSGPWQGRSNRDQLDVALAAAAMGVELELYFLAEGALQLLKTRQGAGAGLPPGEKAWGSLADLVPARIYVEAEQCRQLEDMGLETVLDVQPLDHQAMRKRQGRCGLVLVL